MGALFIIFAVANGALNIPNTRDAIGECGERTLKPFPVADVAREPHAGQVAGIFSWCVV